MSYNYIRIVVCNLYPFQDVISRQNFTLADAVENIDIGPSPYNGLQLTFIDIDSGDIFIFE